MNVQDHQDDAGRLHHARQPSVKPVVFTVVFLCGGIALMLLIMLVVRATVV